MNSVFMHILDILIQGVRTLKLADFAKHEEDTEYYAHDGYVYPDLNPSPPRLLVVLFNN